MYFISMSLKLSLFFAPSFFQSNIMFSKPLSKKVARNITLPDMQVWLLTPRKTALRVQIRTPVPLFPSSGSLRQLLLCFGAHVELAFWVRKNLPCNQGVKGSNGVFMVLTGWLHVEEKLWSYTSCPLTPGHANFAIISQTLKSLYKSGMSRPFWMFSCH